MTEGTVTTGKDDRPARFVNELTRLGRGPLAELRRGLGGDERGVYWLEGLYVRTGYGEEQKSGRDALRLVAGLYALNPPALDEGETSAEPDEPGVAAPAGPAPSVGKLMGRLYVMQGARPSTEKRFLALLDADRDGLNHQLRQAVTLLATQDLTPDWVQLTGDLLHWGDRVRRRWAREFYSEIHRELPGEHGRADDDAARDDTDSSRPSGGEGATP